MVEYKGFLIPKDIILFFFTTIRVYHFILITKKQTSRQTINSINLRTYKKRKIDTEEKTIILEKTYRIASFILSKTRYKHKPCLPRSYIIYNTARKLQLNAQIVIGVIKDDDKLTGHGWVEIDGKPFMENQEYLKEFTVMIKESKK